MPRRVPVPPLDLGPLRAALPSAGRARLDAVAAAAPRLLGDRTIWCVSSTARGGGVAQMLRSLVGYGIKLGIDVRWVVIDGDTTFFRFTKRLHDTLHGVPAGPTGGAHDRAAYRHVIDRNARVLARAVRPWDVVILHDPQTAGLAGVLADRGAQVVWRCHVGTQTPTAASAAAWKFLLPLLDPVSAFVFTGRWAVPAGIGDRPVWLIAPSIDPSAVKNAPLAPAIAETVLRAAGLDSALHPRLVLHLGRWDRLKDPVGVVDAFAHHVLPRSDARLVVAGPPPRFVADDPSASVVLDAVRRRRRDLPAHVCDRITVACLPQDPPRRNALIVNALQRQAAVVAKKSLAEGFGLGVTEALWKRRAVVGSAVGGIRDQIEHGSSGLLVGDGSDLEGFGAAVAGLLEDPARREVFGANGRRRVAEHFLHDRHLAQWLALLADITQPHRSSGELRTEPALGPAIRR